MQLAFATTLLLSAALMFVVEPMFAKMVLPLLGGSPSVWNTCLVFYQAALLAGYIYAHVTVKWLGPRRQAAMHMAVLCLPWIVLPIGLMQGWLPPRESNPIPWLWLLLTVSLGLPFLCVSATAPLLQAWFAGTGHRRARDPYFLYAASNLGSMIGLAAYPLIIESHWTLAQQSHGWAIGYAVLMAMIGLCAIALWRSRGADTGDANVATAADTQPVDAQPAAAAPVTTLRRLRWLTLSLVPSSLLLGVTAHLSTDIAAVPLLWAIPLALYLLSFVLVFARWQLLKHRWAVRLQAAGLVVLASIIYLGGVGTSAIVVVSIIHLGAFFLTAMVCHGELAADRPASSRLTEFYLWMSIGGVVGGLLNALVAPLVFNTVMEYPLMIVAACLLRPRPRGAESPLARRADLVCMLTLGALFALAAWAFPSERLAALAGKLDAKWLKSLLQHLVSADAGAVWVALAGLLAFMLQRRPLRFAAAVATVILVCSICSEEDTTIFKTRSFFGILRVENEINRSYSAHRLLHGSTLHGMQSLDPDEATEPWTYYHRTGPVGDVFKELERPKSTVFVDGQTGDASVDESDPGRKFLRRGHVGVVGLGTGSIAAYGHPGQRFTYFEIDPAVIRIARNPKYFTYIRDCKAKVNFQVGDARLRMAEEPDGSYNVLLIDAFSSDAIPIHLITREAVQLYFEKLAPHGLLMVHISNRHLDLEPVLGNLAENLGVVARTRNDQDEEAVGKCESTWVVLARRAKDLGELDEDHDWETTQADADAKLRLWTDDFSNIVGVIEWNLDWSWLPGWKWWHKKSV